MFFNTAFCEWKFTLFCNNKINIFLLCLSFVIPLSMIKSVANYNVVSLIGNILIILTLGTIFYYCADYMSAKQAIQGTKLFNL